MSDKYEHFMKFMDRLKALAAAKRCHNHREKSIKATLQGKIHSQIYILFYLKIYKI